MTATIAMLVPVSGDPHALREQAVAHLRAIHYYAEREQTPDPVYVVIDGREWRDALPAELLAAPWLNLHETAEAIHLPGALLNRVLPSIGNEFVGVLPIGTEVSTWYANKSVLAGTANQKNANVIAAYRGTGERRELATQSFLIHPDDGFSPEYPRAWLQMLDLVPIANCLIRTSFLRRLSGFSEAPALQRAFWWEFCLRAAGAGPIELLPLQPVASCSWHRYPFARDFAVNADLAARLMMAAHGERGRIQPIVDDEAQAILRRDFNHPTAKRLARTTPLDIDGVRVAEPVGIEILPANLQARLAAIRGRAPLRIAVLGGVNEPAHNQLCFFNYFELMRDWGVLSWRAVLDTIAHPVDLAQSDLVIFSRVRSANGVKLMDFCRAHHIPTLYMLDDNWFWLGREWPEYADLFMPGRPDYECFMHCLKHADTALTYNEVLAEDMRPHAKHLVVLPTNIDFTFFASRERTAVTPGKPVTIGYVGSIRKNLAPFEALVAIAQARPEVRLFVMSNALPDELKALPPERVHFEPYQFNYAAYARIVCEAAPDVLVAPIGKTRFEASKCPNKFLEITASGAAGVYSRTPPYTHYVREGETGLLADDDTAQWRAAIEKLIDDAPARGRIAAAAMQDVRAGFDTRAVLPAFLGMLLDAAGVPEADA